MISLRGKITFSLILMSIFSIALSLVSARVLMMDRFTGMLEDPVAEGFMAEVLAYYDEYGSWHAAIEAESLYSFVVRLRASGELPPPTRYPDDQQPFVFLRGAGDAETPGQSAASLPGSFPPHPLNRPPPGSPPPNPGEGIGPPPPPPPFIVLDETGRIILSPFQEDTGKLIPNLDLEHAIPIAHQDVVIGYLYSDLRASLVNQHSEHLNAINNSWWIALLAVSALSLPLGLLLGRRIAGPIDNLDKAIRAMQPGAIQQKVPVTSKDELGHLIESFNQMSADLSDAYDELEISRQQMEDMSLQDPLTLLPNRRSFDERANLVLTQAYRHNRPCVLAMIDIDRFKQINDNYSHSTGDLVLKLLADLLRSNLREVDILARYGGEEFLVLFPETDLDTAYKLMERLREFIAEHRWPEVDENLQITLSSGLVEIDINDPSSNALGKAFNAADKKLYLAKNNGRNRTER